METKGFFKANSITIAGAVDPGTGNIHLGPAAIPYAPDTALQFILFGSTNIMAEAASTDTASISLTTNAIYSAGAWTYIRGTYPVTNYYQNIGNHVWRVAVAGTAGNAITWTEIMRTGPAGGVNIGGTFDPSAGNLMLTGTNPHLDFWSTQNAYNERVILLQAGATGGGWNAGYLDVVGHSANTSTFTTNVRFFGTGGVYVGGSPVDPGIGSLQVANRFIGKVVTVTYSSSMTIDASLGNIFVITATNSTAFTINAPTNPVSGQEIVITIKAPVSADTGAITWSTAATGFKKTTSSGAVTNTRDSYRFYYDGSNWVEIGLITGVPN